MAKTIVVFDQIVSIDATYLNLVFADPLELKELEKVRLLRELTHLNASSHLLCDDHLKIIGNLDHLEMLDLVMTEITDEGLREISGLHKLVELRLKDNPQLTDACIPYLANLKSLKSIHLGNTDITPEGLKRLLSTVALETVILDSAFDEFIAPLAMLTCEYPKLEILVKGTGTITRGQLDQ